MKNILKFLLLIFAVSVLSCQTTDKKNAEQKYILNKTIEITGTVSVRGNDPHTYLSIVTDDNKEFSIIGKLKKKIQDKFQNQKIKIKGMIITKEVGPGFPAEFKAVKVVN